VAKHFLSPLVSGDAGAWQLVNARTDAVVADALETAFDSLTRRKGLRGRSNLPRGFALILAPCNAIHTFGMKTAIDVVFVDRQGRVVKVRDDLGGRRVAAAWRAFATIELPAHAAAAAGIESGDVLQLRAKGPSL
jgi:uncharacterized membrane protein (UPF0127 family)